MYNRSQVFNCPKCSILLAACRLISPQLMNKEPISAISDKRAILSS
jgi:hypothetical protein